MLSFIKQYSLSTYYVSGIVSSTKKQQWRRQSLSCSHEAHILVSTTLEQNKANFFPPKKAGGNPGIGRF